MPKMNDEQLLVREPYRSVINLLYRCSCTNKERVGLEHAHFLYALMKKPKINFDKRNEIEYFFKQFDFPTPEDRTKRNSTKFFNVYKNIYKSDFSNDGVNMEWRSEIKFDCITSAKHLNDILTLLIKRGWIEFEGKRGYRKYFHSHKFYTDSKKREIEFYLKNWTEKNVIDSEFLYQSILQNPDGFKPSEIKNYINPWAGKSSKFLLCGLSATLLSNLSNEEKKDLNDWLLNIEMYLWKIMELKYLKIKIPHKEFEKKRPTKPLKIEDLILLRLSNYIGFYYTASKLMTESKAPTAINKPS